MAMALDDMVVSTLVSMPHNAFELQKEKKRIGYIRNKQIDTI